MEGVDFKTVIAVDKWDGPQVKSCLDETARQHMADKFNYEEWNLIIDVRLFLCCLPILASLYGLVYDLFVPFPESAPVLKLCVYGYIVSMIILTIYNSTVECHTIMIGYRNGRGKEKTRIRLISHMKPYDDMYTLTVEGPKKTVSCTKSVGEYFDINGLFLDEKYLFDVTKLHKQALTGSGKNK